jgi:hypothetical protein
MRRRCHHPNHDRAARSSTSPRFEFGASRRQGHPGHPLEGSANLLAIRLTARPPCRCSPSAVTARRRHLGLHQLGNPLKPAPFRSCDRNSDFRFIPMKAACESCMQPVWSRRGAASYRRNTERRPLIQGAGSPLLTDKSACRCCGNTVISRAISSIRRAGWAIESPL